MQSLVKDSASCSRELFMGSRKHCFWMRGTANIDEATEKLIVDIIANSDLTRVMVAHRPEIIQRSRRVVQINEGNMLTVEDVKA